MCELESFAANIAFERNSIRMLDQVMSFCLFLVFKCQVASSASQNLACFWMRLVVLTENGFGGEGAVADGALERLFLRVAADMNSQVLLADESFSTECADLKESFIKILKFLFKFAATYKIFFAFVSFLVVQKRCDVFVTCTTNITDIRVCIFHVLSHVNHNLKSLEESMAAEVANVFSQVQIDLTMIGSV